MSWPPRSALRRGSPKRREGGCAFPREVLALHVEGDLSEAAAEVASSHLATCEDCRRFLQQLHARQSLLKSLRREMVGPSECTGMRREVMSIINDRGDRSGWALRIERAIVLGFRRRAYAMAVVALLGLVSVSVLAQMRHAAPATHGVAVFEGRDTLLRPEGYRDWIFVGPPAGRHHSAVPDGSAASPARTPLDGVYINPTGYEEYAKSGTFPEGTLMVWVSAHREPETPDRAHTQSPALLASVKDSTRFEGGWGFFDFTGPEGTVRSRSEALPESSGCRTCHRQDAKTDHVFTQFYPVLRSARHGAHHAAPRGRASLPELLAQSRPLRFPAPPLVAYT